MRISKNNEKTVFLTLCIMGFFAILSSTMSKNPVLKPFALSLGTPTSWTGFVASASTIPGILVSLPAASLSDVYGRKKFLLISGIVFASAPFLYLLITVWWQLILVRFYHGFATAIFVPVAEAALAEAFPTKRGERISLFSSATYVGRVIAPTLGGYILFSTANNFHSLYLAVGIAGLTAVLMALPFLREKKAETLADHEKTGEIAGKIFHGWRTVAQCPGVLLVSFVQACTYYAYGSLEYYLGGYLPEIVKLDELRTGIIITSIIGVGIFARPYMGRVSDRVGRQIPIVTGCILSSLPLFAMPFMTDFWVLLLLAIVYGLGLATVMGSVHALVSDLVSKEVVGTSMGFIDTIMDVGQTLGPIISGFILGISIQRGLQYTVVFPSLGIVLLLAAGVFASSRTAKAQ
jgi:DHA1 family multidrug resistance protein-like MFS transporter